MIPHFHLETEPQGTLLDVNLGHATCCSGQKRRIAAGSHRETMGESLGRRRQEILLGGKWLQFSVSVLQDGE